uniref:Cathepsin L-like n=1 Tax=Cyprinus carpio TaxID=7962 RepID=A0A220NYW2_CYPCA|nr:cathepsin L-like [Cyprinus carpio]
MAFPRLSASMLLASLILLYWTTSAARSHDPPSSVVSPPYRVKRDQPFENREKVDRSLAAANSFLTVVKDGFEAIGKSDTKKLSDVMKSLANVASLAPGVGVLVASVVNMVLIFIPQDDPVLNTVQKGFEEVNRKLDSITIQISNLATDVEWFNYASVYSQDELRILNAWKKFNDLLKNSKLVQNKEQKFRLAEIFVNNYYENTGTEASVANLYHYLTAKDTSLSGNLNELLRKKFKCDFQDISKYNIYFSSLLWKGMMLNQFYWKLIGLDSSRIAENHNQMFKNVYKAQKSALEYCLTNHMQYVKEDVVEIKRGLSAENKQAIADKVKEFLDKKYTWYNWVVLVYNTNKASNYILYDMTEIKEDIMTVAVGYTLIPKEIDETPVREAADDCFKDKQCEIKDKVRNCRYSWSHPYDTAGRRFYYTFTEYAKATHAAYGEEFAVAPAPFHQNDCLKGGYTYTISIYYSQRLPVCQSETCSNNGRCNRLLDSNEWMCECPDGYYGERCEERTPIGTAITVDIPVVPDISTIDTKMKMMEVQLKEILNILNYKCRGY